MLNLSFCRSSLPMMVSLVMVYPGFAQRSGGKTSGTVGPPPSISSMPDNNPTQLRPLYISGNVILQGGLAPSEPIAIERICNGVARKEGYTDFRGQFQIQLGSGTLQFQDVSENPSTQAQQSMNQKTVRSNQTLYEGCELRGVLAGFQSSSVILHITDDFGQIKVPNIVLTRMGNVEGTTISMTSMAAPNAARQAYAKGRKAEEAKKYDDAEKHLKKAVETYPQYAAAWYLLGELHRLQKLPDQAIPEYNQAIKADPQYVSPYFGLAIIAVDQKRWDDVEHLTSQVTHLNGMAYPLAYFYNGAANFNLGKMDAAEQSARKFQSIDTDHKVPDVCLLLANILEAKRDYAGAARQLRDYLALVPNSPRASEIRAEAQRLESQAPRAQN